MVEQQMIISLVVEPFQSKNKTEKYERKDYVFIFFDHMEKEN
jgi:hypothetical protein